MEELLWLEESLEISELLSSALSDSSLFIISSEKILSLVETLGDEDSDEEFLVLQEERRGKEKEMVRAIKKAAKYLIFFIINSFLLTGIYYKGFYALSAMTKKWNS